MTAGVSSAVLPGPGPRFSVVIPALDEEAVLGRCLDALSEQTYPGPVEVIVVDNGSTDQTAAVARRHGAVVVAEPVPGVCHARQAGLAAASGQIVVTTDADTTFSRGWLEEIDDRFRRRPDAVAVGGPCMYVDGPWWSGLWSRLLFGVVAGLAVITGRVWYVTATNLAFYRGAFSGYDTRLTQGGDELDVLRRLRKVGRVVFAPDNPTFTSSRRLSRGLLRSVLVSLVLEYLLAYAVNRLARRTLVRTATVFRHPSEGMTDEPATTAPPTDSWACHGRRTS